MEESKKEKQNVELKKPIEIKSLKDVNEIKK